MISNQGYQFRFVSAGMAGTSRTSSENGTKQNNFHLA
jgi:hypothetical protein